MEKELVSLKELAEILGVHPQTIYQLIYQRKIPYIKKKGIGYRFRIKDINNWIEEDIHLPVN